MDQGIKIRVHFAEKRNSDFFFKANGCCMRGRAGGGQGRAHLVAAVLVEHNQEDGHDHDDADHDEGVEHGVEEALAHRGCVLSEWRVDAEGEGEVSTSCLPCGPA